MSQYAFLPEKNPNLRAGFFSGETAPVLFFQPPWSSGRAGCREDFPRIRRRVQSWRGQSSRVQMAGQLQKHLLLYVAAKKTTVCTVGREKILKQQAEP